MSTSIWSDHPSFDEALRSIVQGALGATWEEITERLSAEVNFAFSIDQVRNRAGRLGLARPAPADAAQAAVSAARLQALRLAESRDLTTAIKAQGKWEDFLDIVRGELLIPPTERPLVIPATGSGSPETMVVVTSDPHIGKLVKIDETGVGFGYGFQTFKARGTVLVEHILRLRAIHSLRGPIPKLVLFFLGDGVDGVDMRRGHAHRVDIQTATQQAIELARFYTWLVKALLPYFPEGIDLNWEYGNHGRVGDFGVNLPSDNWDYIAGVMVEQQFLDDESVTVNAHTQQYGIYRIGPLNVYASHGYQIKGGGGSPVVKRFVANTQNLHRQQFDLVLLGHFHTSELFTAGGAKVFMNGAWDGGDDFSVNQLVAASDPAQWAFGVHPKRGVTWSYEIALAPKRGATPVSDQ